jgi:hypothetical protein
MQDYYRFDNRVSQVDEFLLPTMGIDAYNIVFYSSYAVLWRRSQDT